jgi:glycosyltransferase involved in cell wall biosynthesis
MVASALDPEFGGLPACVLRLSAALADSGHSVTIAGQSAARAGVEQSLLPHETRVRIHRIRHAWSAAGQAAAAVDLARFVRDWTIRSARESEGIVHIHGVWAPAIMAAAEVALTSKSRVVISPHGMMMREAMRKSPFAKRLAWNACVRRHLSTADTVHVTSRQEALDLACQLPRLRSTQIPWGVPMARARTWPEGSAKARVASFLGRMIPIKGTELLIDAWGMLKPDGWVLNIVGPSESRTRQALADRIRGFNMGDRIHLLPPISSADGEAFWASTDLLVLPSRSENFGLVAGEALAAAVPVLTTAATAWTDVDHIGCGWCVLPSLDALIAGLRVATAQSQSTLAEMGAKGQRWIGQDFNWPRIARRFVREIYEPVSGSQNMQDSEER